MKETNVGIANYIIFNNLKNYYFGNIINESKEFVIEYIEILKKSPILQLEFKVFDNLDKKFIENEFSAARYIDNNIKLFEAYTIDEIDAERKKIKPLLIESPIPANKLKLYNAIDNLITESLLNYNNVDVDVIHESFTIVLNHIMTPKNVDNNIPININEDVIELAYKSFNKKYSQLDEENKKLFHLIVNNSDTENELLFETYRKETISILESINTPETNENVSKAIEKIVKMECSKHNIISLHELKKDII